jgi:UDP-N-acetylglucosamine acyltransferase
MSEAPKIHHTAVVHPRAELGARTEVGPNCVIEKGCVIGDDTVLLPGVVIHRETIVGRRNQIHAYAVLGGAPQDLGYKGQHTRLTLGDDNRVREFVTINRGTTKERGETIVGSRNLLMACSHVAHDCILGNEIIMANNVLLAGHVRVGDGANISGAAAAQHFTTIGRFAYIGGMAKVKVDVPPYMVSDGDPALPRRCNEVGLRRHGFAEETISALAGAFREVFRSKKPLSEAVAALDPKGIEEVAIFKDFLEQKLHGKHGRYLEGLRG